MTNKTDTSELEQFIKRYERYRQECINGSIIPTAEYIDIFSLAQALHSELQAIKERLDRLEQRKYEVNIPIESHPNGIEVVQTLDVNPKSHTYTDNGKKI